MVSSAGVKPLAPAMTSKGARKSQEMKATNAFSCIARSIINAPYEDENKEGGLRMRNSVRKEHVCERELPPGAHARRKLETQRGIRHGRSKLLVPKSLLPQPRAQMICQRSYES